jgi:hypothetical protein
MVTTIHKNCMKRKRPSLSPIAVWVRAPRASPAMYTATTCKYQSELLAKVSGRESFLTAPVRPLDGWPI